MKICDTLFHFYNKLKHPFKTFNCDSSFLFQPMVRPKSTSRQYLILGITHSFSYCCLLGDIQLIHQYYFIVGCSYRQKKKHTLQPGSLLGCLVQTQIKSNFISPAQLFPVGCKQNMLKIPYHTVTAHNCCTVPASSQHIRLKNLRVVTGGKKKFCEQLSKVCFT